MQTAPERPYIAVVNGHATTTSTQIAEYFGKRHSDVMRAVRNLKCSPEFHAENFLADEYTDKKMEARLAYTITRDGFVFLAMGFTGKEAAKRKEAYIKAFNAVETDLQTPPQLPKQAAPTTQAAEQFRDLATIAERINSLAIAANIITDGSALPDGYRRKCVAAAIVDTLAELAAKLSESADSCADMNEKTALTEGGAA